MCATIAQGAKAVREILDDFGPEEDFVYPEAAYAADVALAAGAAAGDDDDRRCDLAINALAEAEARADAANSGNGRAGLGAVHFGHRKPQIAARLPPSKAAAPLRPSATPGGAVDVAKRDAGRAKLAAALSGNDVAAAAAEAAAFSRCRGVESVYDKAVQEALLDAQRAAARPAGVPAQQAGAFRAPLPLAPAQQAGAFRAPLPLAKSRGFMPPLAKSRGFMPPRAVPPPPPQPSEPPPAPKLKSTRIGPPPPSEAFASAAKLPKTL